MRCNSGETATDRVGAVPKRYAILAQMCALLYATAEKSSGRKDIFHAGLYATRSLVFSCWCYWRTNKDERHGGFTALRLSHTPTKCVNTHTCTHAGSKRLSRAWRGKPASSIHVRQHQETCMDSNRRGLDTQCRESSPFFRSYG